MTAFPPCSSRDTCSIIITAFLSGGMGWPVFINTASPLFRSSETGCDSWAEKVSSALTAMPSMAAEWNDGLENRANTGAPVTLPAAWFDRTFSVDVSRPLNLLKKSLLAS